MFSQISLVILLFAATVAFAQQCGFNEVYQSCAGCEASCVSPAPCQPKCVCLTGYARHSNGTCILRSSCPYAEPTYPSRGKRQLGGVGISSPHNPCATINCPFGTRCIVMPRQPLSNYRLEHGLPRCVGLNEYPEPWEGGDINSPFD